MDLRYGDVERAMVIAFNIKDKDFGKFRARIRHLRKNAIPGLAKPGTGRQIVWTINDVRYLFMGLQLNGIGIVPNLIAAWLSKHDSPIARWFELAARHPESILKASIRFSTFGGDAGERFKPRTGIISGFVVDGKGNRRFESMMKRAYKEFPDDFTPLVELNISAAERRIQKSLAEAIEIREKANG